MKRARRDWRQRIIKLMKIERLFYGEGPSQRPITLNRRRIFILPSGEGVIFGLVLIAMLFAAINYSNGMIYLLTFLLVGLSIVAILHTYRNLTGLRFQAGQVEPVFAGEVAQFSIRVGNPAGRDRFNLSLLLNDHSTPEELFVDIPAHDGCFVQLPCLCCHRGRLSLGRFTVSSRFPLGLFRAWSYLDLDMQAVVYPSPGPDHLPPPGEQGGQEGGIPSGSGVDDFHALRSYTPQDSPRHVHWKAVARGQEMLTKEFVNLGVRERWFSLDQVMSSNIESRLSQLCRWVLDAEAAGEEYGLRLPGQEIGLGHGALHLHTCLNALALFGLTDPGKT